MHKGVSFSSELPSQEERAARRAAAAKAAEQEWEAAHKPGLHTTAQGYTPPATEAKSPENKKVAFVKQVSPPKGIFAPLARELQRDEDSTGRALAGTPEKKAAEQSPGNQGGDGSSEDEDAASDDEDEDSDDEMPAGQAQPLIEEYFSTPRENLAEAAIHGALKTRLIRLFPDRITVHKAQANKRPEQTIWLRHLESVSLNRLEDSPDELPFRLHLCTPWATLKLYSKEHAKQFLDAVVGSTEHAAGCGKGRFAQPLGLASAVLTYSRYADGGAAAAGRRAAQVAGGLAAGQAGKEALRGAELTHSGTLLKKGRGRRGYAQPWRSRFVELRADGYLAYYSGPHERPAEGAPPDPSKSLDISGATIVSVPQPHAGRQHAFQVAAPSIAASSAIYCRRVPSSAIECHRVPSSAIECHRVPSSAIQCHRLPRTVL